MKLIAFILISIILFCGCAERELSRTPPFVLEAVEYPGTGGEARTALIADDGSRVIAYGILETPPIGTEIIVITYSQLILPGRITFSKIEVVTP